MPLRLATAETEMLRLFDNSRPDFRGYGGVLTPDGSSVDYPASYLNTAHNWAKAATGFFRELSAPPVLPVAFLAAEAALVAAMAPALGPTAVQAIQALQEGFSAYAAVLALPASLVPPAVATPPPAPPPFVFGPPTNSAVLPALAFANVIFAWAKTGLQGAPPAGPVLPWL